MDLLLGRVGDVVKAERLVPLWIERGLDDLRLDARFRVGLGVHLNVGVAQAWAEGRREL